MIATARIIMPKSMVRLSAGRVRFSQPEQVILNVMTCLKILQSIYT